jgi:hypothetical protein
MTMFQNIVAPLRKGPNHHRIAHKIGELYEYKTHFSKAVTKTKPKKHTIANPLPHCIYSVHCCYLSEPPPHSQTHPKHLRSSGSWGRRPGTPRMSQLEFKALRCLLLLHPPSSLGSPRECNLARTSQNCPAARINPDSAIVTQKALTGCLLYMQPCVPSRGSIFAGAGADLTLTGEARHQNGENVQDQNKYQNLK